MNGLQFNWPTFLMALAGCAIHLLASWGEFYRAKDTLRIGLWQYITLDLPAWLAAIIGAVAFYFVVPELADTFGLTGARLTPMWALAAGYMGSSFAPKLLGIFASRAGVR